MEFRKFLVGMYLSALFPAVVKYVKFGRKFFCPSKSQKTNFA